MEKQQRQGSQPLSNEELRYLIKFRELLNDLNSEFEMGDSLAADITKVWACCMDDTWVWGGMF